MLKSMQENWFCFRSKGRRTNDNLCSSVSWKFYEINWWIFFILPQHITIFHQLPGQIKQPFVLLRDLKIIIIIIITVFTHTVNHSVWPHAVSLGSVVMLSSVQYVSHPLAAVGTVVWGGTVWLSPVLQSSSSRICRMLLQKPSNWSSPQLQTTLKYSTSTIVQLFHSGFANGVLA